MDDFFASFRPPTMFSLFPDAIGIVLTHIQLDNETMATLARVNREVKCYLTLLAAFPKVHQTVLCSPPISSNISQMSVCLSACLSVCMSVCPFNSVTTWSCLSFGHLHR